MINPNRKTCRSAAKNALFPALFAVGGSMAAGTAGAVELGEIEVQSSLGQPLRASIAFALGPNEELQKYCVSISSGASRSGLPSVPNARVDIGDGLITVTSRSAVREPIVSTRLTVNCPYTPNITREYTMFLSPPALPNGAPTSRTADSRAADTKTAAASLATRNESPRAPIRRATSNTTPASPIRQGQTYRVQPGESLSEIAQRIENRQIRLWPAVNALFEANPDAFIDADPNRLKAGSILAVPDFVGDEVASFAAVNTAAPAASTESLRATNQTTAAANQTTALQPATAPIATVSETAGTATAVAGAIDEATKPAETSVSRVPDVGESTVRSSNAPSIVIPDTTIEDPIPAGTSPNRSVARIQPAAVPVESASNKMLWALGGGALLIVGLLLFGRRLRDQFGSTPVGSSANTPMRRSTDLDPTESLTAAELPVVEPLADDSPTDRNLALDAELALGQDFDGGVDVDFGENGGMGGTTRLDIELPASADGETDVISAPNIDTSSILESEVLPDNDEYDMSVIMDMTRMPRPEDVTEKDLKAIEVSAIDDSKDDSSYTVNNEVDYDILEQDYQDELTATQALNLEIEKAAKELSKRLENDDADTTNIQIGDVEDMDLTSTVQAQNDATLSDLDDTNVNEALNLDDDQTVVLSTDDKTAEMASPGDSVTVEMPRRPYASSDDDLDAITSDGDHTVEIITRDDDTIEMEIEGGRVNTRR